jgi:hypothetical protein
MTTSPSDARKASKLMRKSKSKKVRSVAASDLAQARRRKRSKKKT